MKWEAGEQRDTVETKWSEGSEGGGGEEVIVVSEYQSWEPCSAHQCAHMHGWSKCKDMACSLSSDMK